MREETPIPSPTAPAADPLAEARAAASITRRWRIAGDIVFEATKDLPDDQRSLIRRLNDYGHARNLTLEELGALINYSATTLSRVFRNDYSGDLAGFCEEVNRFFELDEKRSTTKAAPFITTQLYRRIEAVCDQTREFQKISLIIGDSQIGKTTSLRHYTATHNHGSTRMVEMPVCGNLGQFLRVLAATLNISEGGTTAMRERILRAFDHRMLLIVDEVDRCLAVKGGGHGSIRTLEFIRELYDATQCGVVLSATRLLSAALDDRHAGFARLMEQTKRRRLFNLHLPARPEQADLNAFAAHYGLPPAEGAALALQERVIRDEALGVWLTKLRMAARIAAKQKKGAMSWRHVLLADAGHLELEGGAK